MELPVNASSTIAMQGLHLVADLQGCACALALLSDAPALLARLRTAIAEVGLTVVGDASHRFPDAEGRSGGVTATVLLAESHVALHTWPEFAAVTLDVYVCNHSADNSARAAQLMETLLALFRPAAVARQQLQRCVPGPGPRIEGE